MPWSYLKEINALKKKLLIHLKGVVDKWVTATKLENARKWGRKW